MNGNNTQGGSAPKRLRIMQLNLDKIHIASSSLLGFLESSTLKYSIISLQESQNFSQCPANYSLFLPRHFYRKLQNNKKPRASLFIHNTLHPSYIPTSSRDICVVQLSIDSKVFHAISIYLPNKVDPLTTLQRIPLNIIQSKCILMGDLNSKSPIWGASQLNDRGAVVQDFLSSHNLVCINNIPHEPTFQRAHSSHIDASFVSADLLNQITNWKILPQEWFHSGHKAIHFEITTPVTHQPKHADNSFYDFKNIDKEKFALLFQQHYEKLLPSINPSQNPKNIIDQQLHILHQAITSSIELAVPKTSYKKISQSWWTPHLGKIQNDLNKAFKATSTDKTSLHKKDLHKILQKDYKKAVKQAKIRWFEKKCKSSTHPYDLLNKIKEKGPTVTFQFLDNYLCPITDPV